MNAASRFDNALRYRSEDHPNQTQFTPDYVLDPVREALGGVIELDPCSTEDNPTKAERYYYPPMDGAELPWDAATIFVNPPYSKARERWVNRCIDAAQGARSVALLIPAATDTRIFQSALKSASGVVFIRGRVKFGVLRPNRRQIAASHPSALIGWNVDLSPCAHLGHSLTIDTPALHALSLGDAGVSATRWRNKQSGALAHVLAVASAGSIGTVLDVVIYDDTFGPQRKLAEYSTWKERWERIPEVTE